MSELLIVNPRGRRRRTAKIRRSASPRRRRASAPRRARRTRRSAVIHVGAVNPIRRRRRHARRRTLRRNPISIRRYARRARSKIGSNISIRNFTGMAKTALVGAAGNVVTEMVLKYLPLPAMLKTGRVGIVANMAVGFLTGMVVGKFIKKDVGHAMALGAMTIQANNLLKSFLPASMHGVGEFMYDPNPHLGYANAAPLLGEYVSDNAYTGYYQGAAEGAYSNPYETQY